MQDEMWLATYLQAYNDLLFRAYRDKIPADQVTADCRALRDGMSHQQMIMASVFELAGTFKILIEDAERWGDTRECRQIAWEMVLEMFERLQSAPVHRPPVN